MTDQNYQAWLAYLDAIRASLVHAADKPVFDTTGYGQRTHGGLNRPDGARITKVRAGYGITGPYDTPFE